MNRLGQFGEDVDGYSAPVLNEREIRAAAGILFLLVFTSLMLILFRHDFLLIKYVLTLFLTDFTIRVLVSPRYSPTLIVGRLVVSGQTPEYVSAAPKRVAWILGLALAATMFGLLVLLNAFSPITGIICLVCLLFLFFESSFGICLGCLLYGWRRRETARHCPGDACSGAPRQAIQRVSTTQVLALLGFAAYIVLVVVLFNDHLSAQPHRMFGASVPKPL